MAEIAGLKMPSRPSTPRPAAWIPLAFLLAFWPGKAAPGEAKPFPPDSPEHQALTAASPSLGDEAFTLRQDYWKGTLTTTSGRALRLQFFKGNTYRLFFGAAPSSLPAGARLHLHVFDSEEEEVAVATGEPDEAAVALHLEDAGKTGLYLILMRVEPRPGPAAETEVPAALFYGWQ